METSTAAAAALTTTTKKRRVVHLLHSWAPLLSGSLRDCKSGPLDPTCVGGVASFAAHARHLVPPSEPSVVIPLLDRRTAFVQMHPLGWNVNGPVLRDVMGWNCFAAPPSVLATGDTTSSVSSSTSSVTHDLSGLRRRDLPLLLTNVAIPPSNSWRYYSEIVHFDYSTGLAVMSVADSDQPLNVPQVESAIGALEYVAELNEASGACDGVRSSSSSTERQRDDDENNVFGGAELIDGNVVSTMTTGDGDDNPDPDPPPPICWVPVIYYADTRPDLFRTFVQKVSNHRHPPALIVDVEGNGGGDEYAVPTRVGTGDVWVVSYRTGTRGYYQHRIELDEEDPRRRASNVTLIVKDMKDMPAEYRDDVWASQIGKLRALADEADENDPVVGRTLNAMPVARTALDGGVNYRRCQGGECEIGNLFADALRWGGWPPDDGDGDGGGGGGNGRGADVAFITSGGLRGNGWDAGEVRVSNLWESLPFPNTVCTGVLSGVSLFRLLDYSIRTATFESADSPTGGRLLQVSGMRVVYDTRIEREKSRILSIDVWDEEAGRYIPIDLLRLYRFATDNFLCGVYEPYPSLLGEESLVLEGEVPGKIGDLLHQNLVGEYLTHVTYMEGRGGYDNAVQGRLVNDTTTAATAATREVLNLVQTEDDCVDGETFWVERTLSCAPCPNISNVVFSDERVVAEAESGGGIVAADGGGEGAASAAQLLRGRVVLVNREVFSVSVAPNSLPSWVTLTMVVAENGGVEGGGGGGGLNATNSTVGVGIGLTTLPSGESLAVEYAVNASGLAEGTAQGTVSFRVLDDRETFRGCAGQDAAFDILVKIRPSPQYNHLGWIRALGLTLAGIVVATAITFAVWVGAHRNERVVVALQPSFLMAVCAGVLIVSTAILPLSVDDSSFSVRGCNIACMATPWLGTMGLTVAFSALFSKLWRINKLFGGTARFRRMVVDRKVFFVMFSVLFLLNFSFLLAWTLADPLRWTRSPVKDDQPWNTYGSCSGSGTVSKVMFALVVFVNVAALVLAFAEAYKARHISDEFSESKYLGVALYSWLQLAIVGLPVLFLIDDGSPAAKYFLQVGLIFAVCMSMLLLIFAPILKKKVRWCGGGSGGEDQRRGNNRRGGGNLHISGINPKAANAVLNSGNNGSSASGGANLGSFRLTTSTKNSKDDGRDCSTSKMEESFTVQV